jgi:prepilin-type N-terminal cleavage/methylation domain-containing protein
VNIFLPTSTHSINTQDRTEWNRSTITLSVNKIFQKKGFTLIELLVVISIISILATIGIASYQGAQKNARDARRRNDVDVIAKSLEVNKAQDTLYYPVISPTWFESGAVPLDTTTAKYCILYRFDTTTISKPTLWAATSSCPTSVEGASTTVAVIPSTGGVPPVNSTATFKICARLEGGTQPNIFCRSNIQ